MIVSIPLINKEETTGQDRLIVSLDRISLLKSYRTDCPPYSVVLDGILYAISKKTYDKIFSFADCTVLSDDES